eukprot:9353093-Pyramimonas_sp.AAC.2
MTAVAATTTTMTTAATAVPGAIWRYVRGAEPFPGMEHPFGRPAYIHFSFGIVLDLDIVLKEDWDMQATS